MRSINLPIFSHTRNFLSQVFHSSGKKSHKIPKWESKKVSCVLCYPHYGMAKIQICYVGTQFPLYLWDTPQLRYMYLKVNTYGTYFSCPSLEISSTSLSRRLSIAMSTSKRVAILKGSSEPLMRTLFIEDLTQWYHGLSSSQRAKQHGEMTLKKAVKNRVQYHGERCNRRQFIALWNTTF